MVCTWCVRVLSRERSVRVSFGISHDSLSAAESVSMSASPSIGLKKCQKVPLVSCTKIALPSFPVSLAVGRRPCLSASNPSFPCFHLLRHRRCRCVKSLNDRRRDGRPVCVAGAIRSRRGPRSLQHNDPALDNRLARSVDEQADHLRNGFSGTPLPGFEEMFR